MPRPQLFAGLIGLAIAASGCAGAHLAARSSQDTAPAAKDLAALGLEETDSGEIQQVGWFDRRSERDKERDQRFEEACNPQEPRKSRKDEQPRDIDELLSPCMAPQLLDQGRRHRHPEGDRRNKRVDNRVNEDGCHPERERLPMLKRLSDPENAQSDNKAIKKAAEIKMAEDLADQKIKALKYLGMIGCCVYDKDGGITAAFVAALDDPTPRVRMTAIMVIAGEYCGQKYEHCCTCKKPIVEKLADLAWGIDPEGCYKEPIPEIRAAAKAVVCKCCPNEGYLVPEGPVETPVDPGVTPETVPESVPAVPVTPVEEPKAEAIGPEQVSAERPLEGYSIASVAEIAAEEHAERLPGVASVEDEPAQAPQATVASGSVRGTIESVDPHACTVLVRLSTMDTLPVGSRVALFHKYSLGRLASMIEFEVTQTTAGSCIARPIGNPDVSPRSDRRDGHRRRRQVSHGSRDRSKEGRTPSVAGRVARPALLLLACCLLAGVNSHNIPTRASRMDRRVTRPDPQVQGRATRLLFRLTSRQGTPSTGRLGPNVHGELPCRLPLESGTCTPAPCRLRERRPSPMRGDRSARARQR